MTESVQPAAECNEKRRLLFNFDRAAQAFSEAVTELTKRMGTISRRRYEELKRNSELLRLQCDEARMALEHHSAIHKC